MTLEPSNTEANTAQGLVCKFQKPGGLSCKTPALSPLPLSSSCFLRESCTAPPHRAIATSPTGSRPRNRVQMAASSSAPPYAPESSFISPKSIPSSALPSSAQRRFGPHRRAPKLPTKLNRTPHAIAAQSHPLHVHSTATSSVVFSSGNREFRRRV